MNEFSDIPEDINKALRHTGSYETGHREIDIRAIVLDKDNCFAAPHKTMVWPAYQERWTRLRLQYPGKSLLIVSNSAGTVDDKNSTEAKLLAQELGVDVLIHSTKKPGCYNEVLEYFRKAEVKLDHPSQLLIIGDRLFTDVLMANIIGCHSIWLRRGTIADQGLLTRVERYIYSFFDKSK